MLPLALDLMGGDHAPAAVAEGARRAVEELGVPVTLVGRPDAWEALGAMPDGIGFHPASEVIGMADEPATSVRTMKDSSLVRAAELVRDGAASAMISAGNTGATVASALLRMGRIRGVSRPAIAAPIPAPGRGVPTTLLDAGAIAECRPAWLVQFARMGAAYASLRYGIERPTVGLLSIGEEPEKGTPLVKETHALLREAPVEFVGNIEGRDIMRGHVDVVVTDGFTGNVVLKTLEGSLRALITVVTDTLLAPEAGEAGAAAIELLAPQAAQFDPDTTGGAMLLGVDGICIISHGSSSPTAIVNACRVAADLAEADLVTALRAAIEG
jgi:glycerol-3-phosphate acyltransferase PlsX